MLPIYLKTQSYYLLTKPDKYKIQSDRLKVQSTYLQLSPDNLKTLATYLLPVDNLIKINYLHHFSIIWGLTNKHQQCSHIAKAKTENQPLQRGCKCKTSTVEFQLSSAIECVIRSTTHNKGFCNSGADRNKHQLCTTINTSSGSTVRNSTTVLNINKQ